MQSTGILRKATSVWIVDFSLVGKGVRLIFDSYFESCSVLLHSCMCINKHFCGQLTCRMFWLNMSHFHNTFSSPMYTSWQPYDFLCIRHFFFSLFTFAVSPLPLTNFTIWCFGKFCLKNVNLKFRLSSAFCRCLDSGLWMRTASLTRGLSTST